MGKAFKLRNGTLLLSTEAPGGIYNSAQLKKIAALVGDDSAIVKATEDQRLALLVKSEKVADVTKELRALGLGVRHYQDGLHQPTACIGKHCPEVQQDALTSAMDLSQELAKLTVATPLRIGINGCARCCVPTHTLDVSIVGDTSGYRVSLGGKNSQIPEMATFMAEGVPAAKLPKLIAKVVQVYKDLAQADETLQETMERAGSQKFIEALAPYSQDAAGGGGDPFGEIDAGELEAGGAGPTLEDTSDELAFDKEPAVEEFAADSLEMDGGDLPVDALSDEALADEALAADAVGLGQDADALADDTLGGDVLADDVLADDVLADDVLADSSSVEDASLVEDGALLEDGSVDADSALVEDSAPMEDGALSDEALSDPALVEDELALDGDLIEAPADEMRASDSIEDLELSDDDALTAESIGDEVALDDDALQLAEMQPMEGEAGLVADAVATDEIALDDLPEDGAVAAATGDDEDFEALDPTGMSAAPTTASPKPAVAVAPSPTPALDDDLLGEDAAAAEEIEGAAADEFEEKLNASIAEEESMPAPEDVHSTTRLEAMRLVESDAPAEAVHDDLHVEGGFDNLGIEEEELPEPKAERAPAPANRWTADAPRTVAGVDLELASVEITQEGRLALRFASGAAVMLDPTSIRSDRELTIAGKRVVISAQSGGFSVEVDGVGVYLPLAAA